MHRRRHLFFLVLLSLILVLGIVSSAQADAHSQGGKPEPVRFGTFNASLNRFNAGDLISNLSSPDDVQAQAVAEIVQRTRPEVLLINEFDYDEQGGAYDSLGAQLFQDNYLSKPQNGAEPIKYKYRFVMPSNTGIPSGRDFNKDGVIGGPDDAYGFGFFPGQYGMAVFSQYPIDYEAARTFQLFLWKDMPGAKLPVNPDGTDWYDEGDLEIFRLSSKSHWDVPILIDGKVVHFLTSHPTPPVFDGPEDRNGTRNYDEIRFWADYIIPSRSGYIYDDNGNWGGITPGDPFVIAGDQNSDPNDGDSIPGSAQLLLDHPLVNTKVTPDSDGGPWAAAVQDDNNDFHISDPAFDTADFSESAFGGPGNLRADYVLPRKQLRIVDAGVFWPTDTDPYYYLTGSGFPVVSSDHRLVWIDAMVPSVK